MLKKIIRKIEENKKTIIIISLFILVIQIIRYIYIFNFKYENNSSSKNIEGMVITLEKKSEERVSYTISIKSDIFILNIYNNKKYKLEEEEFFSKYANFKYGDILSFSGKINKIEMLNNLYEFDYKLYLNSKKIVSTITTYNVKKVKNTNGNIFFKVSLFLRENLEKNIDKKMNKDTSQIFKSIIYGDDRNLDESIKLLFEKCGISHLISVSGENLSVFILVISVFFKNIRSRKKNYILIFSIFFFLMLSFFEISLIRASIMMIIFLMCDMCKKKVNIYVKIAISASIMIIYNPYIIFNASFLLSFFATISIVMFYSLTYSFLDISIRKILKIDILKKNKFKIMIYKSITCIFKIFAISFSSLILIFPLQIYYFNNFYLSTFISNIVIYPIVTFFQLSGSITLILVNVPFISDILFDADYLLIKLLILILQKIDSLNMLQLSFTTPYLFEIIGYYIVIFLNYNKKRITLLKKEIRKYIRFGIKFVTIIYILYILSMYVYMKYFEEYVYFFNVEQGNMAIIRENRKIILIDCGSKREGLAANVLKTFMKGKNIHTIDVILITHMHEDHMNGIKGVIENVSENKTTYILSKNQIEWYNVEIKENLFIKNIPKIEVEEFDRIKFDDVVIDVLSPPKNCKIIAGDEKNANSLVFLISLEDKNYLFMGDALVKTEKNIIQNIYNIKDEKRREEIFKKLKNIEAIQIGHHGSKTSSSTVFLDNIKAKYGIISAKKELYGHPNKEILERLENYKIKTLITQIDGGIKF